MRGWRRCALAAMVAGALMMAAALLLAGSDWRRLDATGSGFKPGPERGGVRVAIRADEISH